MLSLPHPFLHLQVSVEDSKSSSPSFSRKLALSSEGGHCLWSLGT